MKNTLILVGILAAALMAGCSGDNGSSTSTSGSTGSPTSTSTGSTGTNTTGTSSSSTGTSSSSTSTSSSSTGSSGSNIPPPPALGSQIDREGRPAINTALTDPFNLDGTQDADKDAYNSEKNPANWTNVAPHFAQSLAVLDGLDANCGNQAFAAPPLGDGGAPADRYSLLASVLVDDRLWLNTAPTPAGTCTTYLGVEAAATSLIPNTDCGGRAPNYDVIDESYSVLAIGAPSGVSDGVDQSGHPAVSNANFPFLAAPQ